MRRAWAGESTLDTAFAAPARAGSLALALLLGACASVPEVDQRLVNGGEVRRNRNAPVDAEQAKLIFARLGGQQLGVDSFARHLAIEEAIAEAPIQPGNRVRLLQDGEAAFKTIFNAIKGAKDHINLEYFIFENVEFEGEKLFDLLIEKGRAGVAVNLIYDSVGSLTTSPADIARLREAGVATLAYRPVSSIAAKGPIELNNRDHRKILVVDGHSAVVGGINMSDVYASRPFKSGADEENEGKSKKDAQWRDTNLLIEGPAVADLQRLFFETWQAERGPEIAAADYFPRQRARGNERVRIIGSTPQKALPPYYVTLLSAINNAEERVQITAAYFVPPKQLLAALCNAAGRGIETQLLLPQMSDATGPIHVGRSHYGDLLRCGVQIYERKDAILHAKTVTIDGVWSVVGSSNLDPRSVVFNQEVDAIVLGRETAGEMQRMFEDDLAQSDRIALETWSKRPIWQKFKEHFARLFSRWL